MPLQGLANSPGARDRHMPFLDRRPQPLMMDVDGEGPPPPPGADSPHDELDPLDSEKASWGHVAHAVLRDAGGGRAVRALALLGPRRRWCIS